MSAPARSDSVLLRWLRFNAVGLLGVGVQLGVLWLLASRLAIPYQAATLLAVEAALLHNFAWHERYTWRERLRGEGSGRPGRMLGRLAAFHLANGAISLGGNIFLMTLLVGHAGLPLLPANGIAIVACSLANFLLGDRLVFRAPGGARRKLPQSAPGLPLGLL